MKRRVLLGLAALGVLALIVSRSTWRDPLPEAPFTPSMERGVAVPVSDYRFSTPYTHENLTIFLVLGPETLDGRSFLTLQEAIEQRKAIVHETGSVNQLAVENLATDEELYIQSGDIVKGGKQDRTLPHDAVIGPSSGPVPIDSFCVEQGRWSKRGEESSGLFSSSSYSLSSSEIRHAASSESSQSQVWRNVANTQERLSKKLGTSVKAEASQSSLQLTLESPALREAVAPYISALHSAPDVNEDAIGYIAVVNGRVLLADVYASRMLFRKLWPKLLDGTAVEAFLEAEPGRSFESVSEQAIRVLLADVEKHSPSSESVTDRTYVQMRRSERMMLIESCDRARQNLVLHRSYLALRPN